MSFVFEPPEIISLPVVGETARFPVRRVFCVGQNYALHAIEMGASGREPPFFFMKPASSVIPVEAGTEQTITYPDGTSSLHNEIEMVVAIGAPAHRISAEAASACIFGHAVGLDVTRRDVQTALKNQGRAWEIAKAFDESAPVGPITPVARSGPMTDAAITLDIDGQPTQAGNIHQMSWKPSEIIAQLSQHWKLLPGDLIFTGTPAGVAAAPRGSRLLGRVEGLESLRIRLV